MTPFQILIELIALIGLIAFVAYFFSMARAYFQSRKKDGKHFYTGITKTQDGHKRLSDVVRDDPRWDKK